MIPIVDPTSMIDLSRKQDLSAHTHSNNFIYKPVKKPNPPSGVQIK